MARRSKDDAIDWEAIEKQYRLGVKTAKQLSAEYGLDNSSIGKRAKKYGWVIDKQKEVVAVCNSLLIQSLANNSRSSNSTGNSNSTSGNCTPSDLDIKAAGKATADVILGHRKSLLKLSVLRDKLIEHIDAVIDNFDTLGDLAELLADGDTESLAARLSRVMGRSVVIDDVKKLAEIDEKIRKGEREAFNIKDEAEKKSGYEEMLERLSGVKLPAGEE